MNITGTNGTTAEVTSQERLQIDNKTPMQIAADNQDAYSVVFEQDSGSTVDDFFYLKNTSDRNLKIYKIMLHTITLDNDIWVVTGVTGTPTGGTAITPLNLYTGGKAADVTCEGKDGDMALTGGSTVDILYLHQRASGETYVGWQVWEYPAPIILPPNTAMVLHCTIDPTADIDGTLYFYFE